MNYLILYVLTMRIVGYHVLRMLNVQNHNMEEKTMVVLNNKLFIGNTHCSSISLLDDRKPQRLSLH